jgi:hypothetical protein
MFEDLCKLRKEEKVMNDLLAKLPDLNSVLELHHIESLIRDQDALT